MVDQPTDHLIIARPDFETAQGELSGYLAHPKSPGKYPAVLVIHENTGLTAHIEDLVRRFAGEGFLAFALDALALKGGTPSDKDQASEAIGALDGDDNIANYLASIDFLRNHPNSSGAVGCVGFCWGGNVSAELAIAHPTLDAAVVYYGKSPDSARVPDISAPLLLHYGAQDDRINATVPAFENALVENGNQFDLHMYEGAGHAFNNDTREDRYEPSAAAESWQRTIAFLDRELRH